MTELLDILTDEGRVAATDRERLARHLAETAGDSESDCLRWTAERYGVRYSDLRDEEPEAALLARFPAALLWREELLPLRQTSQGIEVATSALFRTEGLDALRRQAGEEMASGCHGGERHCRLFLSSGLYCHGFDRNRVNFHVYAGKQPWGPGKNTERSRGRE